MLRKPPLNRHENNNLHFLSMTFSITDMRNSFVVTCMYISTTVFGPILYHLWIYAGSANANFYFATSLAFSTAQVCIMFTEDLDERFSYVKKMLLSIWFLIMQIRI